MTMKLSSTTIVMTFHRRCSYQKNYYHRRLLIIPPSSSSEVHNNCQQQQQHGVRRRSTSTSTSTTVASSYAAASGSPRPPVFNYCQRRVPLRQYPPVLSGLDGLIHHVDDGSTQIRSFSSSSSSSDSSGEDQHAFFQKQLLEMEEERRSLFGDPDDHLSGDNVRPSLSLADTANQTLQRHHQRHHGRAQDPASVEGEEEHKNVSHAEDEQLRNEQEFQDLEVSDPHNQRHPHRTDDEWEDMKQERELLFQFSQEERMAWSQVVTSQTKVHDDDDGSSNEKQQQQQQQQQQSLQDILAEVERLRAVEQIGRSDGYEHDLQSQSSSRDSVTEPTPPSSQQQHHESFSHVSSDGTSIHMVDVGNKDVTVRTATARTTMWLPPDVMDAFVGKTTSMTNNVSTEELIGPKGPIFATAKLAGIMAAKKTSDLIPLCHPLPIDQVKIDIQLQRPQSQKTRQNQMESSNGGRVGGDGGGVVTIDCTCRVTHKTGVEMEALMGASVAALTIYDMTKAVSHHIVISDTRLLSKTGGKRNVKHT